MYRPLQSEPLNVDIETAQQVWVLLDDDSQNFGCGFQLSTGLFEQRGHKLNAFSEASSLYCLSAALKSHVPVAGSPTRTPLACLGVEGFAGPTGVEVSLVLALMEN